MEETVRYTYRLRPGAQAVDALIAEWHRCRYLWNHAVAQMRAGERVSFGVLSKGLTAKRAEMDWLREGSQVAQQQELRTFAQAYDHAFKVKGRRKPRFKSARKTQPSMEYTQRGFSVREGRLILPKGVSLPVVWSRDLPSEPTSVRVYRDSLGHWYASFVVRREVESVPEATGSIGIDWGVSTTATTTDPAYDLPHLGHKKRSAVELAKAQRKMARGAASRGEVELAKAQRKMARGAASRGEVELAKAQRKMARGAASRGEVELAKAQRKMARGAASRGEVELAKAQRKMARGAASRGEVELAKAQRKMARGAASRGEVELAKAQRKMARGAASRGEVELAKAQRKMARGAASRGEVELAKAQRKMARGAASRGEVELAKAQRKMARGAASRGEVELAKAQRKMARGAASRGEVELAKAQRKMARGAASRGEVELAKAQRKMARGAASRGEVELAKAQRKMARGAASRGEVELAKAQRKMARRRRPKGHQQSKGYQRAKREAAKVAKTAQRRNTHAARVWSQNVVANHQTIAIEDFHPKFLARSTMARKAADAAAATVKKTLIEYAVRAGRKVVLVQPAYTTMTCSGCFARAKRLMLNERTFSCLACGLVEDRDRNAARTILAVAERGHTSVESVRHSVPPSEVSR